MAKVKTKDEVREPVVGLDPPPEEVELMMPNETPGPVGTLTTHYDRVIEEIEAQVVMYQNALTVVQGLRDLALAETP